MSQVLGAETLRWDGWPSCPCQCGTESLKLTRFGHVRGCSCRSCTGRRSRAKGQKAQSAVLKAAARAQGVTMEIAPTHEEQARLLVHYESKTGDTIPKGVRGDWMQAAEKQARDFADRQTPRRKWAVVLTMPGGEQRIWMDYKQWLQLVAELMESM